MSHNLYYTSTYNALSANPTIQTQYASLIMASEKKVYKTQTTYPAITSNSPLDWKKYLCYVMGLAGNEDVDPVMSGDLDFAIDAQRPDFEALQGVGDIRFSLGTLLSSVYAKYESRVEVLKDIQRAGGCQIIEDYICNADGVPIKKVSEACEGVDTTPITSQEIISFVTLSYNQAIVNDTDGFIKFLQKEYIDKGWTVTLHTYADLPLFFARAYKGNDKKFYRYYYDQRDYVATALNLTITSVTQELVTDSFNGITQAMLAVIPTYSSYNV